MTWTAPALPPLASLAVIFLPGLFIIRGTGRVSTFLPQLARAILWSLTINALLALLLSAVHLPPALVFLVGPLTACLVFSRRWSHIKSRHVLFILSSLLMFLLTFLVFSLPFLTIQNGLPTGDSQKSIYWAKYILDQQSLPDYSLSFAQLNRDPVDFYTPALHAVTAAVMQVSSPGSHPWLDYTAVGFLAIALSLATAVIALSLVPLIMKPSGLSLVLVITPLMLLTHFRFLRYLREPGYHLQNIAGELLLFGGLLLLLSLLHQPKKSDVVLLLLVSVTLGLTHQFSAFLSAFVWLPAVIVLLTTYWTKLKSSGHLPRLIPLAALVLVGLLSLLVALDLVQKIPHLFNTKPHLLILTPTPTDYLDLLGAVWLMLALVGLYFIYYSSHYLTAKIFVYSTLLLLGMSQAPRFYIDIPPVRALLYAVVPLSIAGAVGLSDLLLRLIRRHSPAALGTALLLILVVTASMFASVSQAFQLSHNVRTNSTMLPEHWPLLTFLQAQTDQASVLYDDYNRRSSSWLIMSGHPVFARLSSDLKVQMQEAKQSTTRQALYLKQLDFEKIYLLGSQPAISTLLDKYNIKWLVGVVNSSSESFTVNPAFQVIQTGSDLTLFSPRSNSSPLRASDTDYTKWLFRPTTLANDLGDPEDTFLHLPASLRATRLSAPQVSGPITFRTSTAPLIPLYFNINDYVSILWDQDGNNFPDNLVQLSVRTVEADGQLSITFGDGLTIALSADGTPANIPARAIDLSAAPYLIFTINNPSQQPVNLDLIALGLSRTP